MFPEIKLDKANAMSLITVNSQHLKRANMQKHSILTTLNSYEMIGDKSVVSPSRFDDEVPKQTEVSILSADQQQEIQTMPL